jgi:hypothetical protein
VFELSSILSDIHLSATQASPPTTIPSTPQPLIPSTSLPLAAAWINTLHGWQWAILGAIPPAIVALYFLKLRRRPLEVPSTFLWRRTIEDLRVNSLWQRLRRSLLLLLQLLLITLVMFAVVRPGWRGKTLPGNRFILLIDTSASMGATDIKPNRLELAKSRAAEIIDQMKSGDVAMIISFSDRARVEQPFTDNRRQLQRSLRDVELTNRTSDLTEALRVAAGLANPGQSGEQTAPDLQDLEDLQGGQAVQVADSLPASLFIFSDGNFRRVRDFSMGQLTPTYVQIGEPTASNIAVAAFSTRRNELRAGELQGFVRLENHSRQDELIDVKLYLNGELFDQARVSVPAGGSNGVEFELGDLDAGELKVVLEETDDLAVDNRAYAAITPSRRARVLLITEGNRRLEWALSTDRAKSLAEVSKATPEILRTDDYTSAADGDYDLIIFDRCAPRDAKQMPRSNTLFIGSAPPIETWKIGEPRGVPGIIDIDRAHPLLRLIDLGNVLIAEAKTVKPPKGGSTLIESPSGPIFAIAPRGSFEDAVLGFEIIGRKEDGTLYANTDWVRRFTFPIFVHNVLEYFGGNRSTTSLKTGRPGQPVTIRTDHPVDEIRVRFPSGRNTTLKRREGAAFTLMNPSEFGVYEVIAGDDKAVSRRFAVNLFDSQESNIKPRDHILSGYEKIEAETAWQPKRRELWKWLIGAAIIVLGAEWYIFNRRVYL